MSAFDQSCVSRIRSRRCDETYIRVAGQWVYLYRAIDSAGNTIDFVLSPRRDFIAARAFLQLAVAQAGRIQPGVINVDGHPAYPAAIEDLKRSGGHCQLEVRGAGRATVIGISGRLSRAGRQSRSKL
jgi:transposase-like protein